MKKASRLLILLLVLSAILIGCGDSGNGKTTDTAGSTHEGNGKTTDTAGSTHDHIYCDENPSHAYVDTFDELLKFMNEPDESKYDEGWAPSYEYVINHSKSNGYIYSVENSNHEFFRVGIAPYQTLFSDGGIVFDTPFKEKEYEYAYSVSVLVKDASVEYSGDIVEYSLKRFGYRSKIKDEYIYRTFTAQNGLGDFYVAIVYDGLYYAYTEIDDNYYMSVGTDRLVAIFTLQPCNCCSKRIRRWSSGKRVSLPMRINLLS